MAKYSTGGGGDADDGDACELCGRETADLRRANVAGASLLVCADCAPHDDAARRKRGGSGGGDGNRDDRNEVDRKKRAAQNAARVYDASRGDARRWEREGTDYEEDRLPYLVSGYGGVAESARQDAGLQVADLAAELGVDEDDVLAVEQGRAARAGVGGSVVRKLEERLGVTLVDE
jgi:ribosome-binding protein aMBF1 (putative translation factor)